MEIRALQLSSVASMIDLFNTDNIRILQSLGYAVDVASNFAEGSITSQERVNEYRKELETQGISTYQIPIPRTPKKVLDIFRSYKIVKSLSDERKYHIVHCHSPIGGVICRLACRNARKKYGTKVIYTAHGFHFFKGAPLVAWLLYYPVERWCSKYTDVLITINQEDYKNALGFNAKRIEYVPGIGVHTEEIKNVNADRESIRSYFGFNDDDFVFMSTGQVSKRKNHETVIKALYRIEDKHVKYLIVGFGEEEEMLKELVVKLKLQDRVVFAGYRSNVKEILHAVDAFAFPSKQEGLPVALMEAMSAGLPIVCSNIRGNSDLIENGKGGYLYNWDDVEGFALGMKKIIKEKTNNMGIINRETMELFDIRNVNAIMRRIYSSL